MTEKKLLLIFLQFSKIVNLKKVIIKHMILLVISSMNVPKPISFEEEGANKKKLLTNTYNLNNFIFSKME